MKNSTLCKSMNLRDDKGIKKYFESIDKASFGAPREVFNKVVGPNNFNYQPFVPS
jgi:hypothetical protein